MEYKRSSHVEEEEEEEEEEDDLDDEEEEDEEEENRAHHYTTAPAVPVAGAPQQQLVHGQAPHGHLGSHSSMTMESAAAFSRPLLPPNSSLLSQTPPLPPPGFLHQPHRQAHQTHTPRSRERGAQHHHHQPRRQQEPARNGTAPPPPEPAQWRYRECLRNHAARLGAHVLDGCCEFMPSASEGPGALACAACGCHRSFHRREAVPAAAGLGVPPSPTTPTARVMPLLLAPPHMQQAPRPHVPVPASPTSAPAALTESSSEELRGPHPQHPPPAHHQLAVVGSASAPPAAPGKKRFRTKFTAEQKERMREFAEKQGWRINRNDDGALERFCHEIGVRRQVLKVWMHNHKNHHHSGQKLDHQHHHLDGSIPAVAAMGVPGANAAAGMVINPAAGTGTGVGGGRDDDDDDDTDDSPPRAAVSSPSPSPISV